MARLESTKRAKLKTAKQHQPSQKSKSLTCCYLLPRFWVTPYLVPIGTVNLKKKMFPSTSYSFLFQIKAVAHMNMKFLKYFHAESQVQNHICLFVSPWIFDLSSEESSSEVSSMFSPSYLTAVGHGCRNFRPWERQKACAK